MHKLLIGVTLGCAMQVASAGELLLHTFSLHQESGWAETHKTDHYIHYTVGYQQQTGPNTYVTVEQQVTQYLFTETSTTFKRYNKNTFGIGYITDNKWIAGTYKNSFGKRTVYFGKQIPLFNTDLSVNLAVASGYKYMDHGRALMPMVAFDYKLRLTDALNLHTTVVPKINSNTTTAVMISVGHDF